MDSLTSEEKIGNTMLSKLDFGTVAIYLVIMLGTGIYSMKVTNRSSVNGFFLAGRHMWWLPVGASLYASNIGAEHFIGLAGSGAASGIYVGAFELNALVLLQLLGWVFLPVFLASEVNTLPQYMTKRFGGTRIKTVLATFSLLLYVLTKISVNLYSGAIFMQLAFQWHNLYLCVIMLLILTALLTIGGGLTAVIYTDTVQFFIMNIGSLYVMFKAFAAVGGYKNLQTKYMQAIPSNLMGNSSCGIPRIDSWQMLRSADPSQSDMPWPAFLLGQTPASIWYWCADQMMVQRTMSASSLSHAQGATLFAGYAKILPLFMIVFPGMISRVLFPDEIACVDPEVCQRFCGSHSCTNYAYPKLVFETMPTGMRGIMLSVMLSALISDLTSIFNSASTLFTMDIWSLIRPKSAERELLLVGRLFILFLVVSSILWIPIIEQTQGSELYIYIQAIAAYLSPPIAAIYCLAILWHRINEQGAFYGLMIGFLVGITRMAVDFSFPKPPCYEPDLRHNFIKNFHYMYFAMTLFWLTVGLSVCISLLSKPPAKWQLARTTFFTRFQADERKDEVELTLLEKTEITAKTELFQGVHTLIYNKEENECENKSTSPSDNNENVSHNCVDCICYSSNQHNIKAAETRVRLAQLRSLHQNPKEKRLLNVLLGLVLLTAIAMYVFFSINPFTSEEVVYLQQQKLTEYIHNNSLIS